LCVKCGSDAWTAITTAQTAEITLLCRQCAGTQRECAKDKKMPTTVHFYLGTGMSGGTFLFLVMTLGLCVRDCASRSETKTPQRY
jgi:hypothetical protein